MKNKITVISHIFNEEYLLPWWLEHHLRIFDHGIIIDYGSTDRSLNLIKHMAPLWEIIPSRFEKFDAYGADLQVMEQEERIDGWKISLNTTEFLFHPNIRHLINTTDSSGLSCTGVYLVDTDETSKEQVSYADPILKQKTYGVFEEDGIVPGCMHARSRLLHCYPHGDYPVGRHIYNREHIKISNLFCVWLGFSPMNDKFIQRKLQIRPKIPQSQISTGIGISHVANIEELLNGRFGWNAYKDKSSNLRDIPDYNEVWSSWYD